MNKIKFWLGNARSGATMQSIMPAILTVVLAIGQEQFSWWLAILAVLGVWFAHLAMNLVDDYFDYRADMHKDREQVVRRGFKAYTAKYPYLTDGSATVRQLVAAIGVFVLLALICGVVVACQRSWAIFIIVALAGFFGVFYSAPPLKLCYHGLGELVIGFIFGPLLMQGVWWAAAGNFDWWICSVSVPIGLLVVNILYTHSMIDREGDAASDKLTLAGLMRTSGMKLLCSFLINFLPYIIFVVSILMGTLHPLYLLVLLVLPRSIWLFRSLVKFERGESIEKDLAHPSKMLGPLGDWAKIRELGLDWFLIRWLTSRNIVSAYCLVTILVHLVLIIFHLR